MNCRLILVLAMCVCAMSAYSQQDTSHVFQPAMDDSSAVRDTADTTATDTLSDVSQASRDFEQRMRQFRITQAKAAIKPRFSAFDTLCIYFASPRLNQSEWLSRSFALDASDYFKADPSFVVLKPQLVPMRNIVQPYGLTGDRLNILDNGLAITPFEQPLEPDGSLDLSDVPIALHDSVYLFSGASGMMFGGDNAVATMLARTVIPADKKWRSALVVDKGQLGYSHVRGRYSNRFTDGRAFDLGVAYRIAKDPVTIGGNDQIDNAYQYNGNVFWPFGQKYGLHLSGYNNARSGRLYQYAIEGDEAERDRFDRNFRASFVAFNDSQSVRNEFGYGHMRQGSNMNGSIKTRLDLTGHSLFGHREWISGKSIISSDLAFDFLQYANGYHHFNRRIGDFVLTYAKPYRANRLATTLGLRYVEAVRALPRGSVTLLHETNRFFLLSSIGYTEREPSLNEWFLPFTPSTLLYPDEVFLASEGNQKLDPERQITGTIRAEWGAKESSLRTEVTGGHILDAIEWQRQLFSQNLVPYWRFRPINTGESFLSATLSKRFQARDWLHFLGGASYHKAFYDSFDVQPYQPEYQAFGGMELHYYWRPKLIHLWAYGEVVYYGPYEGYVVSTLGNQALFNAKLSFNMGNFRFRVVYQNALNQYMELREGLGITGWQITWGFNWNFYD